VSALLGERHGTGPSDGGAISLEALEQNPYPIYRRLRDEGVVWVEAAGRWLVTRWDDVDAVERDSDAFTAMEEASLQTRVMGRTMLRTDGAAHRRLRRAAQTALSPQAIERHWLPEFSRIADELIDAFADHGAVDLMPEFCGPFAARCLGHVLGLHDASDRDLQFWSQALMDGTANYADDPEVWARSERAVAQIDVATDAAIARVQAAPDQSVISAMAHADGDGRPLTRDEIVANTKLMIGGGLNEPRDGLAFAIWALLTHPEARAKVVTDRSSWATVTEEALRWMSPLAMFPRQVAKPVRLADTTLEPGARLGLLVASANRDERHWERADRFDVHRPKQRTVAFGVGHHFCLGVWMARHQIGGAALPALFERLDALALDLDNPPEIRGWVFRGPTRLHVTWSR
jgi:cytochrome P450